jgi:hypothetical protein
MPACACLRACLYAVRGRALALGDRSATGDPRDRVATEIGPPLQLVLDAPPTAAMRARARVSASDAQECFGVKGQGEQAAPRESVPLGAGRVRRWKLDSASSCRVWLNSGPLHS